MKQIKNKQYWEEADRSWSEDSIWFSNTASPSARRTFFYVQEVGYFKTIPPYYTERANLNSFLIFCTLSGKGILTLNNSIHELLPGTIAFINCMDYHHYQCAPDHEWEFLWLHFHGPSALGYYENFIKNGFRICHDTKEHFIEGLMQNILNTTQKKDIHSEIIVSNLITDLLTHLLISSSTEDSRLDVMPEYLKNVTKKIDQDFTEPLSLDDLAREFGISKYHLSREFKRYMGTTINEYLTLTRLNYAKELLKYTSQTVEQAAFSCGFHHVSHFINVFKAHESLTPLQFKKEWGKT